MAKVIVEIGYRKYVVDAKQAVAVAEMLSTAEVYETRYAKDGGGNGTTTHHVFDMDDTPSWYMHMMPDSLYRMAKLAGKPPEDK